MGLAIKPPPSFIKGAACLCLDILHTQPVKMNALAAAIQGAAPGYANLEKILENNLLNLQYSLASKPTITEIVSHLENRWFGTGTPAAPVYFPGVSVSQIYAQGLLETIAYSQSGATPPAPIDAYWSVGHLGFEMIVVADPPTKPTKVTLIIATPMPRTLDYP